MALRSALLTVGILPRSITGLVPSHALPLCLSPAAATVCRQISLVGTVARLSESQRSRHRARGAELLPTAWELPVPDGMCVAVRLPSAASESLPCLDELHPHERQALAAMAHPMRRLNFAGGRVAIRRALQLIGATHAASDPVLSHHITGAPLMPDGVAGSISHTNGLAVAYVSSKVGSNRVESSPAGVCATAGHEAYGEASEHAFHTVGVDVERSSRLVAMKVSSRVLSEEERATLGSTAAGITDAADLLLRISIKEALYKALHPILRRPIRWHSVHVYPGLDGACAVDTSKLESEVGRSLAVEANWGRHEGFYVTMARARLLEGNSQ